MPDRIEFDSEAFKALLAAAGKGKAPSVDDVADAVARATGIFYKQLTVQRMPRSLRFRLTLLFTASLLPHKE